MAETETTPARCSRVRPYSLLLTAMLLALAASCPSKVMAEVFAPETFRLDNGMQVVVVNNPRAPVVTHVVWYRVGSADEPDGQSGIAHLLEHLMFNGTDKVAEGEFSRRVARHGGRDNAFTSQDYTAYFQTIASDRLELVMRLEADRMTNLLISAEMVETERMVVAEERRQRIENQPGARLGEEAQGALFLHHPYGTPIIGWRHEILALTREDALRFYEKWYVPGNAILVVSGDITLNRLRPLAERTYGRIAARPVPSRARTKEPPLSTMRDVVLRDPLVRQPETSRRYKAPSYGEGDDSLTEPLQVLAEALGGGSLGRLYRRLVVEEELAISADARYSPSAFDLATFSLHVTPVDAKGMKRTKAALEREIKEVLRKGIGSEEVEAAKERLLAEIAYARDDISDPAFALGEILAIGRPVDTVEQWPQRIEAVTAKEVNAAAKAVFAQDSYVTTTLLPRETARTAQ